MQWLILDTVSPMKIMPSRIGKKLYKHIYFCQCGHFCQGFEVYKVRLALESQDRKTAWHRVIICLHLIRNQIHTVSYSHYLNKIFSFVVQSGLS